MSGFRRGWPEVRDGRGGCNLANIIGSDFSGWTAFSSSANPTLTGSQTGPTGLSDAYLLVANQDTDVSHAAGFFVSVASSIGTQYTYSFWAKAGTTSALDIARNNGGGSIYTQLTLTSQWQRFSLTWTAAVNPMFPVVGWGHTYSISGKNVLIARPMLNIGPHPCIFKAP